MHKKSRIMKKSLLAFLAIFGFCLAAMAEDAVPPKLYFDFEGEASTNPVFSESSAKFLGVMENPSVDAVNGSDSVGLSMTSATDWDGIQLKFGTPLDLRADTVFTMLVYHPDSTGSIRLQFDGTGISSLKLNVDYSTPGQWELLTWRIPSEYDGKINRVLLVFDHNNGQPGGLDGSDVEEWYFDELRGPELYPATGEFLYFDFEGDAENDPVFSESSAKFLGVRENPSIDDVNGSDSVGLTMTSATDWDGIQFKFNEPLDLSGDTIFTMLVYHPDSMGSIRLQFDGEGMSSLKINEPYTTPGAWEMLTWPVPAQYDSMINRVLLVFDHNNGQPGGLDGSDVEEWYFDEMRGTPEYPPPPPPTAPPKQYYNTENFRKDWTGFDGATYEGVVDNPSKDDVNGWDHAGMFMTGNNGWSGISYDLPSTIDFSEWMKFRMWVYSDSVGYVRVQLESSGGASTKPKLSVLYDTPGQWKELDFTEADNLGDPMINDTYDKIVLIFDDRDAEAGETWYFDNVLGPPIENIDPVRTYVDFETPETSPPIVAPSWESVIYAGVVENPHKDDVNGSDSVGLFITGNVGWQYIEYYEMSTIDFSEGHTFSMKVYNADSIGNSRIQLDDPDGKNLKMTEPYTTAGQWQVINFDVNHVLDNSSGEIKDDWYRHIKLIFDDLANDAEEYWYFDDVKGPALTPIYYINGLFTVQSEFPDVTGYKIEIDNDGNMIDLYDDGTNGDTLADDDVWTMLVEGLSPGDHVYDILADDALVTNGDDVAFTMPMTDNVVSIEFVDKNTDAVFDESAPSGLVLYPNPAHDRIWIECDRGISALRVYNITGAEVISRSVHSGRSYQLDTSELPPGIYAVRVTDEDGKMIIGKCLIK